MADDESIKQAKAENKKAKEIWEKAKKAIKSASKGKTDIAVEQEKQQEQQAKKLMMLPKTN